LIHFHTYVINIHNFGAKITCYLQILFHILLDIIFALGYFQLIHSLILRNVVISTKISKFINIFFLNQIQLYLPKSTTSLILCICWVLECEFYSLYKWKTIYQRWIDFCLGSFKNHVLSTTHGGFLYATKKPPSRSRKRPLNVF